MFHRIAIIGFTALVYAKAESTTFSAEQVGEEFVAGCKAALDLSSEALQESEVVCVRRFHGLVYLLNRSIVPDTQGKMKMLNVECNAQDFARAFRDYAKNIQVGDSEPLFSSYAERAIREHCRVSDAT